MTTPKKVGDVFQVNVNVWTLRDAPGSLLHGAPMHASGKTRRMVFIDKVGKKVVAARLKDGRPITIIHADDGSEQYIWNPYGMKWWKTTDWWKHNGSRIEIVFAQRD